LPYQLGLYGDDGLRLLFFFGTSRKHEERHRENSVEKD